MRFVLATAALAAATALAVPAFVLAQGAPQTVQLTKVDVIKVATGYRASKVIGASVVNEANDTAGKVDDIIIGQDGKTPFVILSVGGFLGMGEHYVAVSPASVKVSLNKDNKWVASMNTTKEALKAAPEFKYPK